MLKIKNFTRVYMFFYVEKFFPQNSMVCLNASKIFIRY